MSDIPLIAQSVALATTAVSAMYGFFKVGLIVGGWKKTLEDTAKQEAVIAMVPLLVKDFEGTRRELLELKESLRGVSSRVHSDIPPMRERLASHSEDLDELKALRVDARLTAVERITGSRAGMPAVEAPRPRTDPRRDNR